MRSVSAVVIIGIPLALAWGVVGTRVHVFDVRSESLKQQHQPVMVALGDSFMSGEGIGEYIGGTATATNLCHRSASAYPYQVAEALGLQLVLAACSGATTRDILGGPSGQEPGQYPQSPDDVPGARPQIELLSRSTVHSSVNDVGTVIVSIGGNDARFGEIVRTCLRTDCRPMWDSWMHGLDEAAEHVREVHEAVAKRVAKGARVLVTLYPAPIVAANCGALGEQLSRSEVSWVVDTFLDRLNYVIRFWAEAYGFEVVDLSRTFNGVRLCEAPYDEAAANAFNLRRNDVAAVRQLLGLGSALQGSFHPNARGHRLMANAVLAVLRQPPTPSPLGPPSLGSGAPIGFPPSPPVDPPPGPPMGLPPALQMGLPPASPMGLPPGPPTTPPPYIPGAVGVPTGERVPDGLTCRGVRDDLAKQVAIDAPTAFYRVVADPGSPICYRSEHREWVEAVIPPSGIFDVPLNDMSEGGVAVEVWYSANGRTSKLALEPQFKLSPRLVTLGRTALAWIITGVGALGLAIGHQIYCWRCCRRRKAAS